MMQGPTLFLFKIAGIEVRLDPSVIIIFSLIVYSLGSGLFPVWHPDWPPFLTWGTALLSGVLFFFSLLAHELSHSVVAQKHGVSVPRITLFLFGGMAETSREPDTPRSEFFIAIAGPLMSMLISLTCSTMVVWIVGDDTMTSKIAAGDQAALAALGPFATMLLWLSSINMILALFNLIPGFPMDGGRVFRAAIWGLSGDKLKATRWASYGGRIFGWTLIVLGISNLIDGETLAGLWWILIGWFISHLAQTSYTQLVTQQALKGFQVHELMNTRFDRINSRQPLQDFIDNQLLRSSQQQWPVFDDDRLLGFVSLEDIIGIDDRRDLSVGDIMRELDLKTTLDADSSARHALESLAGAEVGPVPVMRAGELVGFIQPGDILRWLALHDAHRH